MTTYEHDLMPTEIRARDLTPGDLVHSDDLRAAVNHSTRDGAVWEVSGLDAHPRPGHIVVDTVGHGGWSVPADLPMTVNAAICSDCGDCVGDCVCEQGCIRATEHLPGQDHRWQECPTYHDDEGDQR